MWAAAALGRAIVSVAAYYLRRSPVTTGKQWLLAVCRRVLRALPAFSPSVTVAVHSSSRSVRLLAHDLGSARPNILSEWLFFAGAWQPALTHWLVHRLQPGDIFVDVGANTGFFTLLAGSLVGERGGVVAIEASEQTMQKLCENVALNDGPCGLARRVRTVTLAASDRAGELLLYENQREPLYSTTVAGAGAGGVAAASDVWTIMQSNEVAMAALHHATSPSPPAASLQKPVSDGSAVRKATATAREESAALAVAALADGSVWRSRRVPCARLDDILSADERRRARVIKIDVEGGEWSVLCGLATTLAECRDDLELVVELTPAWLRKQGVSATSVIRHMYEHGGFHAYALAEDYEISRSWPTVRAARAARPRRLRPGEPIRFEQADVIFSREDAECL